MDKIDIEKHKKDNVYYNEVSMCPYGHSHFWLCVRILKKIGKNSKSQKVFFFINVINVKKYKKS